MSAPVLEGTRVRLRPLQPGDAVAYVQAFADDPELENLIGVEHGPTLETFAARVERPWADPPELRGFEFAIADRETDAFLGSLFVHSCDWWHRRAEVGFWVATQARGQGALTEALGLILDWLFDTAEVDRVEMTALPENEIVPRIAERFGYTYEGTLRQRNFERGRRVDLLYWGLLRSERG